jgi:hypothetical protein
MGDLGEEAESPSSVSRGGHTWHPSVLHQSSGVGAFGFQRNPMLSFDMKSGFSMLATNYICVVFARPNTGHVHGASYT